MQADNNNEPNDKRANAQWDAIVEGSPFLKNFLGPVKAQVDAMTKEQTDRFLRAFMEGKL
jgi:hypothetical protein